MSTEYDFSTVHSNITKEGVFNTPIHRVTSHTMTPEELKKWRHNVLELDVPKTVQKAVLQLDKLPVAGSHLFFENGTITTPKDWSLIHKEVKWISCLYVNGDVTDMPGEKFYSQISRYERQNSTVGKGKSKVKPIRLNTFRIMLPTDFKISKASLSDFASYIMKKLGTAKEGVLPYFYAYSRRGDCNYLWIFTTERYYYPTGKTIDLVYKHDVYRQKGTNYLSSKDGKDSYLYAKKGTVYNRKTVLFSDKTRKFSFPGASALKGFLHNFKGAMIEYFKAHNLCQDKTMLLPRLNYKKYRKHSRKYNTLFILNSYFQELEKAGEYLMDGIYALNMLDSLPGVFAEFKKIRHKLADSMEGTYHEYGKPWRYTISALMDPEEMVYILDVVSASFLDSVNALHAKVFGLSEAAV